MLKRIKAHFTKEHRKKKQLLNKEKKFIRSEKERIRLNVLLLSHSLEKGSGISNVKKGYGEEKALKLIENLLVLDNMGEVGSFEYAEGIAVLKSYIKYKHDHNEDISEIEKRFKELSLDKVNETYKGGYSIIEKQELEQGASCDFETLVKSRHSLRHAADEEVKRYEFLKAIEIANHAPSACNRQPCKVYCSFEKDKNERLSKLVPGNKSFADEIPYYCVVTAERDFFPKGETLQWYLNGGIYVSYLTLALHSLGIGSCIFQWPDFYETEETLRKLAGIKKSEAVISIIGFGKYPEKAKYIYAQRRDPKQVVNEF